tara:strand:+ start:433 stop:651 length:219 start_codon:yes stop_codon:yes gene_type:complete
MSKVLVEGHRTLIRDTSSSAIVNTDRVAYSNFMKRISEAKKSNDDLRGAIRDINNIKSEMHEIKDLLKKMVK